MSTDDIERAIAAAVREAGWDWQADPAEGVPSPQEAMRPIVMAALAALRAPAAQSIALTPSHRHAATGAPVGATRYPPGDIVGLTGALSAVGWICRWITALGGTSCLAGHEQGRPTLRIGTATLRSGDWVVHDGSGFTVHTDAEFRQQYVTELLELPDVPDDERTAP